MGGNLCNASPAADSVPAMIAAGATVRAWSGPKGRREVAGRGDPRRRPARLRSAKGEFVVSVLLPAPPAAFGRCLSALHPAHRDGHRGGRRAASASTSTPTASARRRASSLGAVAPTPLLVDGRPARRWSAARSTRPRWTGSPPPRAAACKPIDDKRGTIEYRIKVAGVLARRAAADRARAREEQN